MPILFSVTRCYISEDYNEPLFRDTYKINNCFAGVHYCFPYMLLPSKLGKFSYKLQETQLLYSY